jgi:hypothetical protein
VRPIVRARPEEARPESIVKHLEKSWLVQKEARVWLDKDGIALDHEEERRTVDRNHVNVEGGLVLGVVQGLDPMLDQNK